MSKLVLEDRIGSVSVVTLNRPERHNSLVPELLRSLLDILTGVGVDDSVRAVVLQANGRSFSTGGDAKGFVEHEDDIEAYSREIVGLLNQVILSLVDLPVPVVTAVHGIVTGGSMGLIIASDIVLVAPEARFTPYYSVIGPSPDGGWATLLPLIIGPKRAADVLYLNGTINPDQAVTWGLANRIVPQNKIREEAINIAQSIAHKKTSSIRHTRRLLHIHRDEIATRLSAERDHFVEQMVEGEGLAGFREFLSAIRSRKAMR